MPLPATVPVPPPALVTTTSYCFSVNVAVTDNACDAVTSQTGDVPLHAPPHPVNSELASGSAVSVITAPSSNSNAHVVPQSMPAGEDVMRPLPLPDFVMSSGMSSGGTTGASSGASITES